MVNFTEVVETVPVSANPSDLQTILDRLEAGRRLSQREQQTLIAAVRSQQITIATDGAAAIGGSADGAVIVTGV